MLADLVVPEVMDCLEHPVVLDLGVMPEHLVKMELLEKMGLLEHQAQLPVQLDLLGQLVLTGNLASLVLKVMLDQLEPLVVLALLVLKDWMEPLVSQEDLVHLVNLEQLDFPEHQALGNPGQLVHLVSLVSLARMD